MKATRSMREPPTAQLLVGLQVKISPPSAEDQFAPSHKEDARLCAWRGLTYDYCAVNSIVDKLRANDYKFTTFCLELSKVYHFASKRYCS